MNAARYDTKASTVPRSGPLGDSSIGNAALSCLKGGLPALAATGGADYGATALLACGLSAYQSYTGGGSAGQSVGPSGPPYQPPPESSVPTWVKPVAIGAGVLLLLGGAYWASRR